MDAVNESRIFENRSSVLNAERGKMEVVWYWELTRCRTGVYWDK